MTIDISREEPNFILPNTKHPYYIVAAPYIRTSAGIRVLHLLCHSLNRKGQTAYILLHHLALPWRRKLLGPDLLTPILTQEIVNRHFNQGMTPILVYPEVIVGNPYGGPCVVRYVLNYPGHLGGEKKFDDDELCYSYSGLLAAETPFPNNILFLPSCDTQTFYPPTEEIVRNGTCYYAHKYKKIHDGKTFDITNDSIEIKNGTPDAQTPQEIAEIFRRSEIFYIYENTALGSESILCECPVVLLPNPYLSDNLSARELGIEGTAWGTSPSEIERAKNSVRQGAINYYNNYETFWSELDKFIRSTQKHADQRNYTSPIKIRLIDYIFAKYSLASTLKSVTRRLQASLPPMINCFLKGRAH